MYNFAMSNWYLLMTRPKQEDRAKEHLENQAFTLFYPRLRSYKLKAGRQVKVLDPLFPRYLFIQLDELTDQWSTIRSTRGVIKLVKFSEYPAMVPPSIIDSLRSLADESGIVDQTASKPFIFAPGDKVEITQSSFKGLQAIIKEQNSDQRVILLISMLGKQQQISLPLNSVMPV